MNTSRGQLLPPEAKVWRNFQVDTACLLLEIQMKDSHSEPRAQGPHHFISDQPQPPMVLPPRALAPLSLQVPLPGCRSWPQVHPSKTGLFNLNRNTESPLTEIQPFLSLGMSVSNTHDFVTGGNQMFSHRMTVAAQSQNMLCAYRHREIMMVIRPATGSRYLMRD